MALMDSSKHSQQQPAQILGGVAFIPTRVIRFYSQNYGPSQWCDSLFTHSTHSTLKTHCPLTLFLSRSFFLPILLLQWMAESLTDWSTTKKCLSSRCQMPLDTQYKHMDPLAVARHTLVN